MSNDQVQRYLKSLEWDGVPRIARALGEGNSMERAAVLERGSTLFFWSAVQRALQPGCAVEQSLVLVAPQASGKTRWLKALGGEHHVLAMTHADMAVVTDRWIIEAPAPKMGGDELFKTAITAVTDKVYQPHGRNPVEVSRSCVFVVTTNIMPKALLGSRRFFVVEADALPDPSSVRDLLWAEAVAEYERERSAGGAGA